MILNNYNLIENILKVKYIMGAANDNDVHEDMINERDMTNVNVIDVADEKDKTILISEKYLHQICNEIQSLRMENQLQLKKNRTLINKHYEMSENHQRILERRINQCVINTNIFKR